MTMSLPRRGGSPALLVLVFGVAGCSSEPPVGVSGTVTVKGAAPKLPGLMISFVSATGAVTTVPVAENGTYMASGLASGETRVGFAFGAAKDKKTGDPSPEDAKEQAERRRAEYDKKMEPRKKAKPNEPPAKVPLPQRYLDPLKSGITTTLKPGDNVLDVDLK
ncbi:hypothetical protein [Frigoriglobus tundricola]|uniref:Uncharacterized protein n=1 Tax=Frigoriglobus tundricola TaxID=2774151 RepID=A0A6M5YZH1_9BACT|nr:hypothetical protein [Frigoriglobus tundricola]QJW99449.1 hypothetical protein FTUN_7061 [Frigoriglobus tundricola]